MKQLISFAICALVIIIILVRATNAKPNKRNKCQRDMSCPGADNYCVKQRKGQWKFCTRRRRRCKCKRGAVVQAVESQTDYFVPAGTSSYTDVGCKKCVCFDYGEGVKTYCRPGTQCFRMNFGG